MRDSAQSQPSADVEPHSSTLAHLTDPFCGKLSVAPCTVKAALGYVRAWHRHLPEVQGGLFAASCVDPSGYVVAVAIAGNPPRVWQGTGRVVISRVAASVGGNACGMLYGALASAAKALGYREAWTYTLPDETGKTLRGAGFVDMGLTAGGEHDRPSRRRAAAVRPEPKRRWLRVLHPVRWREAIRAAWCAETSYWPGLWRDDEPSIGQCAVTALAYQALCGGQIVTGWAGGVRHYWNRVDGVACDFTAGQFPPEARRLEAGVADRAALLADPDTRRRYELLTARLKILMGRDLSGRAKPQTGNSGMPESEAA
jgi:hypothetical protein